VENYRNKSISGFGKNRKKLRELLELKKKTEEKISRIKK
jgi:hypothetical protein